MCTFATILHLQYFENHHCILFYHIFFPWEKLCYITWRYLCIYSIIVYSKENKLNFTENLKTYSADLPINWNGHMNFINHIVGYLEITARSHQKEWVWGNFTNAQYANVKFHESAEKHALLYLHNNLPLYINLEGN